MSFSKKSLSFFFLLLVALCCFSFTAYAEYNPSKAINDTLDITKQSGLNFIRNNYLLSIAIIFLLTFGSDIYFYASTESKIRFSYFTTIPALIAVIICTAIKLFY